MDGPARGNSQNSSSKYPTIGESKASDARTPSSNVVWNQNADFNAMRLQTIMESIQRMVPQDSPLVALAQQGVEAVGNIITASPSNDQAKRVQSEAPSSASGNRHLVDNDAHQRITQNRW
jgi:hypothetical protein